MASKRSREGYLLIDHKASPGLPPDFMRNAGLVGPSVAGGAMWESPTMTCAHCGTVVVMNPQRTRARGYCAKCDDYVCDNPGCNSECKPFNQILDEAEKLAYRNIQQNQSSFLTLRKD